MHNQEYPEYTPENPSLYVCLCVWSRLQQRALENFSKSGVEVKVGVSVVEVTPQEVRFQR